MEESDPLPGWHCRTWGVSSMLFPLFVLLGLLVLKNWISIPPHPQSIANQHFVLQSVQ